MTYLQKQYSVIVRTVMITGSVFVLCLMTPALVHAQSTSGTTTTSSREFTVPAVKSWFDKTYEKTEIFRKKQQTYFVSMRDDLKETLKIEQKPVQADTTIDIGIAGIPQPSKKVYGDLDNPLDYVKYIFASSLATLCSSVLLFYTSVLLLGFIVLKFIIRLVV